MSDDQKPQDKEESKAEFVEKVIGQLTCPICYETLSAPIYMCKNGHGVCSTCQAELKFCGECRAPGKPAFRCVQLEKIAALVRIPCENQKWGCAQSFPNAQEMAKHLGNCEHGFVCFMCPDWKGSADALDKHVVSRHASCHVGNVSCNVSMRFWTAILADESLHDKPYFYMLKVGVDVFWMELMYTSAVKAFSTTLRIVSCDESDARRYHYSVEFRSNDVRDDTKQVSQARVKLIHSDESKMNFILLPEITESCGDGKVWYVLNIFQTAAVFCSPWR